MKLTLFIGPMEDSAARLRALFQSHAPALAEAGIATPEWNHVRLYTAVADPDAVTALRYKRGLDSPLAGQMLTREFETLLAKELPNLDTDHVALAAAQLGGLLTQPGEIARLKALLSPHFDQIRIIACVDHPARMLLRNYANAVQEGRSASLAQELELANNGADWWSGALALSRPSEAQFGHFEDVERPPAWLDFTGLLKLWHTGFEDVHLVPFDAETWNGPDAANAMATALGIAKTCEASAPVPKTAPETAASLTRQRHMNAVLGRLSRARRLMIPRDLRGRIHRAVRTPGPPIDAGSLSAITRHFQADLTALTQRFPALAPVMTTDDPAQPWEEADPQMGFRATQYLAAFLPAISKAAKPLADLDAAEQAAKAADQKFQSLAETDAQPAEALNRARVTHQMLLTSPFRPHNNLGAVNEEELAAAFAPQAPRKLAKGETGNVIVACMKNEAPYIVEWIAYHRAIGIDGFLIYTNDCDDSTYAVLDRLQAMGILQHRRNENWTGNSPQQDALNKAMVEPIVQNAAWIAHIDVDEFINIRAGNGTLDDLFAAVPDATNIAMTWRLFGHNGISDINDRFVIDQFDACAPKFCPKPHTVWGFKTLFRNIGAYAKLSCHRPNKLADGAQSRVKWVNGSGRDMTAAALRNGWRSSKATVGYDLIQLNHYALRSADSFLIKRQRGRALHVDRSIGLNYWIRMDWCDYRDITIKRNLPRLRAEYDALMADAKLAAAHADGLAWHRAKADALRATPEFAALYDRALATDLTETERVAYALSQDMES